MQCDSQQIYQRCDAAIINDSVQSNSKHTLATAAVVNASTKEQDRRHKKHTDKNRIKTGNAYMY